MEPRTRKKRLCGKAGELAAAWYLLMTGHGILARNWRCRSGELDIVARKGGVVVFVEVRTRRRGALVDPLQSVDPAKMGRIKRAARLFLAARGLSGEPCRFDVVAITLSGWLPVRLRHVRRAFDGDAPARNGLGWTPGGRRGRGWSRG